MTIPDGYARTEDLVAGDEIAHHGSYRKVARLERGMLGWFRIHLDTGHVDAKGHALWRLSERRCEVGQ
jgi:hypothetical protein